MRNDRSFASNNTLRSKRDNFLSVCKNFQPASPFKRGVQLHKPLLHHGVRDPQLLEIEIERVTEILDSSDLNVTCELEVFNAVNAWLLHCKKERARHAKTLLLKVRLLLFSRRALERLLHSSTFFSEVGECLSMLKQAADGEENTVRARWSRTHRYCEQKDFKVLVCGGKKLRSNRTLKSVLEFGGRNLKEVKRLPRMTKRRKCCQAVFLKGDVFVFGGDRGKKSVEVYSGGVWAKATDMPDDRVFFCACSFMDKILVLGGRHKYQRVVENCLELDTKTKRWREITGTEVGRCSAAGAVFEGRVVVCGGRGDNFVILDSVESYDVAADQWSPMATMLGEKFGNYYYRHSMVATRSKLIVTGPLWFTYEVYDSTSKKFTLLKSPQTLPFSSMVATCIGTEVMMMKNIPSSFESYDVAQDEWRSDSCEHIGELTDFSFVKVPVF